MFSEADHLWMQRALQNAEKAASLGEVPVGAVLVANGELLAESFNQPITRNDPSAHAEIMVLREAALKLRNYRLPDTELFVTIEPCLMCAGALVHARVKRLVFGAKEPKAGAVISHFQVYETPCLNHQVKVEHGLMEKECSHKISEFFKEKRLKS